MSPKFLAGESYGTLRAAALAEHLQGRYGMYLNGVMLISSVLDLGSIDFEKQRNDRAHALYLPTYGGLPCARPAGRRGLRSLLTEAEAYASRDTRGCCHGATGSPPPSGLRRWPPSPVCPG